MERFTVISARPFDEIVAAIKASIGNPNMAEFVKSTQEAKSATDLEVAIQPVLGRTGMMLFVEFDQGMILRKGTDRHGSRIIRLVVGNPLASRDAIEVMREQLSPPWLEAYWKSRFPGQIDPALAIAEALTGAVIQLEGNELVSIRAGHTDTRNTTCLHVPSIGLVVAGDVAYNDVHIHLGESTADSRKEWIAALDMIESLKPRAVVAGHKRPGRPDAPTIVEETRQYIRDFDRIAANTQTANELYDEMLAIYPDRVNPAVLWNSARAVKD